jgi:hypothetical protein
VCGLDLALILDLAGLVLVLSPRRARHPLPCLRWLTSPSSPAGLDLILVSDARGGSIALVSTSAFISGLDIVSTGAFVSVLALAAATRYSTLIASPHPFLLCETER